MTGMGGCREVRHALGAYVLGALDPAERTVVDEHLVTCVECREELAGLAGLPALLRRVPVSEAQRLASGEADGDPLGEAPSDRMLRALLARAAQARRVRRWRSVVAAAALVVLALGAGAGATVVVHGLSGSTPAAVKTLDSWQTVSGSGRVPGIGMTVRYAGTAWGTTMAVQVTGLQAGTACQFQVTDSAGHTRVLGRWRVGYGNGDTWYPVSASVATSSLRSFQVTSGGKVVASASAR